MALSGFPKSTQNQYSGLHFVNSVLKLIQKMQCFISTILGFFFFFFNYLVTASLIQL